MNVRWTLPVGVGATVVAASLLIPAVAASAGVDLPDRTADQLLVDLQGADVRAVQGTVLVDADLGLPSLPVTEMGGPAGEPTDAMALLDGETTLRVWASTAGARVAVTGELGETDVITDGTQVWVWSSDDRTVTHLAVPADAPDRADALARLEQHASDPRALPADLTPQQVAEAVLDALDPSTAVTTGPPIRVAGRPAYQLVLTPEAPGSLVGSVTIAVDAAERVATRVTVTSTRTDAPALTVGWTEVSFTAPDPSVFAFEPPAGATVTEPEPPTMPDEPSGTVPQGTTAEPQVELIGEGWTTVLALAGLPDLGEVVLDEGTADRIPEGMPAEMAEQMATDATTLAGWLTTLPEVSGPWGTGRQLTSNLLTVLLTDDGRVLLGAVDPDTLHAAAAAR